MLEPAVLKVMPAFELWCINYEWFYEEAPPLLAEAVPGRITTLDGIKLLLLELYYEELMPPAIDEFAFEALLLILGALLCILKKYFKQLVFTTF